MLLHIDPKASLPESQLSFLEQRLAAAIEAQPDLDLLAGRLKELAGGILCARDEPHLYGILVRGIAFLGVPEIRADVAADCHANSARLWRKDGPSLRIATGYGLSADGIWRQHSWLVTPTVPIADPMDSAHWHMIETTEARVCYFGYVLSPDECTLFAEWELG